MKTLKYAPRTVWLILSVTFSLILSGCSGQMTVTEIEATAPPGTRIDGVPFRIKERYALKLYHYNPIKKEYEPVKGFRGAGAEGGESTHITMANTDRLFVLQFHGDALADTKPSFGLNIDGTLKEAKIEITGDHGLEAVKELTKQIDAFKKRRDELNQPPADNLLTSALTTKHEAENAVIALQELSPDTSESEKRAKRQAADLAKLKANLAARAANLPLPYPGFSQ